MIAIESMSKDYKVGKNRLKLFSDVNIDIPTDRRVAILGAEHAGKSVLIRMLAGLEGPSSGRVNRYAALSFPVGYARSLKVQLSGRQNAEHVARLYGADPWAVAAFVGEMTELGDQYDEPVRHLPPVVRGMLACAIAYATPFDTYLVDEQVGLGSTVFRARCAAAFEARANEAGIIVATRHPNRARELCDCGAVIMGDQIYWFDDISEAIRAYQSELAGN